MFFLARPSAIPSRVTRCYAPGNVNDLGRQMLKGGQRGCAASDFRASAPPLVVPGMPTAFHGVRIFHFFKHFLRLVCEDDVSGGRAMVVIRWMLIILVP